VNVLRSGGRQREVMDRERVKNKCLGKKTQADGTFIKDPRAEKSGAERTRIGTDAEQGFSQETQRAFV